MFYNKQKNCGWLVSILKRMRSWVRQTETLMETESDTDNDDDIDNSAVQDDLKYLKTIVVTTENLPIIKEKLRRTLTCRSIVLSNPSIDLLVEFPFFFLNVELVRKHQ